MDYQFEHIKKLNSYRCLCISHSKIVTKMCEPPEQKTSVCEQFEVHFQIQNV